MEQKRVVMKDIAEVAKVHQTTVSLALRNDPRISLETRERIQGIAKSMGYTPDPMLSSLISYRRSGQVKRIHETIALIFDVKNREAFEESDYLPSIRDAVVSRAAELGYRVDVLIHGVDFRDSAMLDRILKTRGIHGVLIGGIYQKEVSYALDWDHYSIVKIGANPMDLEVDTVMGNYPYGVRKILRKLKEAGYKRPAMAGSVVDERNTRNAYCEGFLYGQTKHFEPENRIPYYEFERRSNQEIVEEIYQWLREVKPDVFISYWNNLIEAAFRLQVEDGHDCRFVCAAGHRLTIPFGGLQSNHWKLGITALELLVGKLQIHNWGLPESPTLTLVDSKWHNIGGDWPPAPEQMERIKQHSYSAPVESSG